MKTGLGIRPELFHQVLEQKPLLGFVEAHSENYFGESLLRSKLLQCRQHYPLSLHGVGLSLGRADALNLAHLQQLKNLVDEMQPILVSEHLAWSAYSHIHLPDLLPLPLTEESLEIICAHIQQMQDALQRQILIENPSNYLLFDQLHIPEPEFLNIVATRTGCGLLLDINNIYVSSINLQREPGKYIEAINPDFIQQYHLAGHTETTPQGKQILVDTHNREVCAAVWELYRLVIEKHGIRSALIEWDSDYPPLSVLLEECQKADQISGGIAATVEHIAPAIEVQPRVADKTGLADFQHAFLQQVLRQDNELDCAAGPHRQRIRIYQNNVFAAVLDYLREVYPAVQGLVGQDYFRQMSQLLAQLRPPQEGNIHHYGADMTLLLEQLPELDGLPYLKDLMDYEWGLHKAYFAPAENSLDPNACEQDALLKLPVRLKQSVTFIDSCFPVYEIHRQSLPAFEGEIAISLEQAEDKLLVYKHQDAVLTHKINHSEAALLRQLTVSKNLTQAIEQLSGSLAAPAISSSLARVFELQLLTRSECGLH